jgi:hypothetical protein
MKNASVVKLVESSRMEDPVERFGEDVGFLATQGTNSTLRPISSDLGSQGLDLMRFQKFEVCWASDRA